MPILLYLGNLLSQHGLNKTTIDTLGQNLENEGFKIIYSSTQKKKVFRFIDMAFSTFMNAKKVDYILIDTYSTSSFWYAFFCSQIARCFKTKYIPLLHGGNLPERLHKNPKLCQLIFKNAYQNVAPSEYLKHYFNLNGFQNVIVIPNSIQLEKYFFKKRESFYPNLLWVRAFASIYNPKMAVDVLYEIQKKYPYATLTMIGPDKDGSLQTTKEYASRVGVKVNFTGKLSLKDWTNLAQNHDIFINTTHFDNTPVSILEALALGLIVVSTNVGGIPFLLKNNENAMLINDNQVVEMSNAINFLIENIEFSKKIQENGFNFVKSFHWNSVFLQWNNLLK